MRAVSGILMVLGLVIYYFGALGAACGESDPSGENPTLSKLIIAVESGDTTITDGDTLQFETTAEYSDGSSSGVSPTSWASSDQSVGVISTSGFFTSLDAGTTNVSASMNGVSSNTVVVTVVANQSLTSISFDQTSPVGMVPTEAQFFTVTGSYATQDTADVTHGCSFVSSDTEVGNFSGNYFTALKVGATTVTATHGAHSDQLFVIVEQFRVEAASEFPEAGPLFDEAYNLTVDVSGGTADFYNWTTNVGVLDSTTTVLGSNGISFTGDDIGLSGLISVSANMQGTPISDSINFTVRTPQVVLTSTATDPAAIDTSYTLTASATGGTPDGYSWTTTRGSLDSLTTDTGANSITFAQTDGGVGAVLTVTASFDGYDVFDNLAIDVEDMTVTLTGEIPAQAEFGTLYPLTATVGTGTPVSYSWTSTVGTLSASSTTTGANTITFNESEAGDTGTITVVADFGGSVTAFDSGQVTVRGVTAPAISGISADGIVVGRGVHFPATVNSSHVVELVATATDEDGGNLSYLWTADHGSFTTPDQATTDWNWTGTGLTTITLTVTDDNGGGSDVDSFEIVDFDVWYPDDGVSISVEYDAREVGEVFEVYFRITDPLPGIKGVRAIIDYDETLVVPGDPYHPARPFVEITTPTDGFIFGSTPVINSLFVDNGQIVVDVELPAGITGETGIFAVAVFTADEPGTASFEYDTETRFITTDSDREPTDYGEAMTVTITEVSGS